jgi:hypothetical protein
MPRAQLLTTVGVTGVLTVVAVVVGVREWALPERVLGGWQVAEVPRPLLALLVLGAVVCLVVATVLTMGGGQLRLGSPAGMAWLAIVVVAAGALAFNALVLAADARYVVGALIPVLHWLFTFVPALLAGALTARRGAAVAVTAALGTGVVTMPLFALGWALFASREPFVGAVGSSLWLTAILGALPLLFAGVLVRGWGRARELRALDGA